MFGSACASPIREPARPSAPTTVSGAPSSLFRLGEEYAQYGDNLRAEQYFLAAMGAGYPEQRVLPVLLEACVSSGRLRSALGYAEPYLRRHPDQIALRHLVAAIHLGLRDAAYAFRELQAIIDLAPNHAPSHYLLAVIADEAFVDMQSARQHFLAYLKLAPHGPHAAEATSWLREHSARPRPTLKGRPS